MESRGGDESGGNVGVGGNEVGGDEVGGDEGHDVLVLVTAHPDDESMFFAPLVLAWKGPVLLLCLSTGDYDGLGEVREREVEAAARVLGIDRVEVGSMEDSPIEMWDADEIGRFMVSAVEEWGAGLAGSSGVGVGKVTVASFDEYGVSGHINHVAACLGSRVGSAMLAEKGGWEVVGRIEVASVGIGVKYLSWASGPFLAGDEVVVSGWRGWRVGVEAMLCHRSQMVWFRWLYVLFSAYMIYTPFVFYPRDPRDQTSEARLGE